MSVPAYYKGRLNRFENTILPDAIMNMSTKSKKSVGPNAYTSEEIETLKGDLSSVKSGSSRLLLVRYKISEPSQTILDVVFSSMLLTNYLLIGSGSGRIVKLIDLVGVGKRFSDEESYGVLNYGRALLGGGFASFENLKNWCHILRLDSGEQIAGMTRFEEIRDFLETTSTSVLSSYDLEVAEASISIGGLFDGEDRFRKFDITQKSSISTQVMRDDLDLVFQFDQVSDFDSVIVRSTKSRNIVQLDMDVTRVDDFLKNFEQATKHLCDLNFMRNYNLPISEKR